jgi:hypothetical protein
MYVAARGAPSWTFDSPFIVVLKYRIFSSFPNFDYEGRVKSPIRGAPSGHIYKLGVTNGQENMTKMGGSAKRS